jgi:hypothetical protein
VGLLIMLFFIVRTIRGSRIATRIWHKVDDPAMAQLARAITVSMIVFMLCAVFLHALNQKIWWMIAVLSMTLVYAAQQTEADMGDLAEEPEDQ